MNLGHLQTFARVAELGSLTKAAVSLGIAQPTVSRIISELETEWDGPLFYRTGRGVILSELGEAALVRVRSFLREAEQMSEDLRGFSRLPSGNVAMGLPPSLVGAVVPELVNQLRRDLPGIRIRVFEGFSEQIERWLAEGNVDVAIYSKYREGESSGSALLDSRLVLAGAADGWTLPKEIDFRRLAEFPLVLPEATNGLRAIVDSIARRMKVSLNVVADADSILAQKGMAMRCGCYMIKAPLTISGEESSGVFASSVICNPSINRSVVVMTGQQKPLSRAGREVAGRTTAILRVLSNHR